MKFVRWHSWVSVRYQHRFFSVFNPADYCPDKIRNFCIIAHIDHGKTTISDSLLTFTGTLSQDSTQRQYLDKLQVEKERGITIKAQTASMIYQSENGNTLLNLVDTPGHVDFSYEVSRSMIACQGALLLVDASQGVQAQTLANWRLAMKSNLAIVPILTKIDMPHADIDSSLQHFENNFVIPREEVILTSARKGIGIKDVLNAIVERIPAPNAPRTGRFQALLFDSWWEPTKSRYICLFAIKQGQLKKGDAVVSCNTGRRYNVRDIGVMYPEPVSTPALFSGQIGFVDIAIGGKADAHIGDTFFNPKEGIAVQALPGFKVPKPIVYASIFPVTGDQYTELQDAIEKLCCNDGSVEVQKQTNDALGHGFQCGFLGFLHLTVFNERLKAEYNAEVISTPPTVTYKAKTRKGDEVTITKASEWIENALEYLEPVVQLTLITPLHHEKDMASLCRRHRAEFNGDPELLGDDNVIVKCTIPLNEIIHTFYSKVKSLSHGYASVDYEPAGYLRSDLVKIEIRINRKPIDTLSIIMHKSKAEKFGRAMVLRLKEAIPRQVVDIVIQAAIGKKIIAREELKATKGNATAKCYGGDFSRKRKLIEEQKERYDRLSTIVGVRLPPEAFRVAMQTDVD
eukprot:TRINITY_DN13517_c0_g1_i1.p1 TRINITY_DN13517_c0_g1~~TRINITY_DN13517_c0_g1_i1.p1  ORF type:complete len:627 (+),score=79.29 TRINITY_DN13517_c0_g1_i1:47-1927(+)